MISFNYLKRTLVDAPVTKPPMYDVPFELLCDVRHSMVGVTLGLKL
jgi:hypothetical protein